MRSNFTHGLSKHRVYKIWKDMKRRCSSPKCKCYKYYGGRGIKVCDEWLDVVNFYNWSMSHGYAEGLQIDRIDNDGNYCPENCRWVTPKENKNNMSSNVVLEYEGKKMNLKQWSEYLGVKYFTICNRWERGWPIEKILSKNVRCAVKYVKFNGEEKSVHDWAEYFGINQDVLSGRLKRAKYNMEEVYNKFEDMRKFRDN